DLVGLLGARRQAHEPLLRRVHAGLELASALVEVRTGGPEIGETAVQVLEELALRLHRHHRLGDALGLLLDAGERGRERLERLDPIAQIAERGLDAAQPRAGLRLDLPHARDLLARHLRLLERVPYRGVRSAELLEIAQRRLDRGARLLESRHLAAERARRLTSGV